MAQFDLKNAVIDMKDGFSVLGAVNNALGYTAGASTIAVDAFSTTETASIVVGDQITFAGHDTIYTIVSFTNTLAAMTSVVITPVLTDALVDNEVVTVGPHKIRIKVGEGNLTFMEKKPRQYIKDRGKLDTVRDGDEEPVDVKLEFQWQYITNNNVSGAVPTPVDALKKIGPAAAWITSATDTCEPYAVDLVVDYTPLCTDQKKEIMTIKDFRYEELSFDLKQGQISVSGKCNNKQILLSRVDQ
jgi:hypothetical protein